MDAWRTELADWIERRDASLRQPDGWLSLAGLYWLEQGESSFGADPSNTVVFPEGKAPPRVGVLRVSGRSVRVRVEPGVPVTHAGAPVDELELATDLEGEPTLLELGPLLFYAIERGDRIAIRLKDRESPLLRELAGMARFAPDPSWRLVARLERYEPPKTILVPNVAGPPLPEPCPGRLVFEYQGGTYLLEPTGKPGEELFLVFGDETNGAETYGGGRFLYADWPGPDGAVVLDFNRSYNPPCVFTPWATCPLPPPQNKLPLRVEAGERRYGAAAH
ncbi:MAG TPA: DUF1684 domain-containing protein [Thermoanaerobaculia bacterium]|nr:DUF1684 domain-containing protein [Thermoanaerobaculia bacterium]